MKKKQTRAEKAAEKYAGIASFMPKQAAEKAAFLAGYKLAKRHAVEAARKECESAMSLLERATLTAAEHRIKESLK